MTRRALVVDDDPAIRALVSTTLRKVGFAVDVAESAESAWASFERQRPDIVVSDIYMGVTTGLSLLENIAHVKPRVPVILMTARGSVESAAAAQRFGAFDYLAKPFDLSTLLERVNAALRPEPIVEDSPIDVPRSSMIGAHPSMVEVYKAIAKVAPLDVPVLILGETGTGKELVARAIHEHGPRSTAPFVAVNCGAIPDTLLESELFGFVKGAFTDARRDRAGAFVSANGGTVFLDEIGDVALSSQVKLLRFLQDRSVRPLGSDRTETVDVRIVAATNQPLPQLAAEDRFRRDLYYRLAAWEICIPPLRDRRSDIELLTEAFRLRACDEMRISCGPASRALLDVLMAHDWPGNVRELEQVVRRLLIQNGGLGDDRAAARLLAGSVPRGPVPSAHSEERRRDGGTPADENAGLQPLETVERTHIRAVLEAAGGNRTRAAEILGIDRRTLARKLKQSGLEGLVDDDDGNPEEQA
ncbi:MAG: sigma-54 dependent transcriptional regulator [Thermoanaerobaculia bacterium]|nr:sigma-54 dependent transcriptional regulator [Thermoanaerobaculia bacterium]